MKFEITGLEQFVLLSCNDLPEGGGEEMDRVQKRRINRVHDILSPDDIFMGNAFHTADETIALQLSEGHAKLLSERLQEMADNKIVRPQAARICLAVRKRLDPDGAEDAES